MPKSNTVARSMHDVGLAAWFGGSLMGAVGLNAASGQVGEAKDRARVANTGWDRWTYPNAAAIGAHLTGAALLLKANKGRVVAQKGAGSAALAKTALTAVALGATAYSRVQGQKIMAAGNPPVQDGVTPSPDTPSEVAAAQKQLKMLQWVIPASTGALLVLAAAQSEQQRPAQVAAGMIKRFVPNSILGLPDAAQGQYGDLKKKAAKKAKKAQKQAAKAQRQAQVLQTVAKQARERAQELSESASGFSAPVVGFAASRAHDVSLKAQDLLGGLPDVSEIASHLPTSSASPFSR